MENYPINSNEIKLPLETWGNLARFYNLVIEKIYKKIKLVGLTLPQFSILETLGSLGAMKIGELSKNMIYNGGNMTLVLDQLEAKGYLHRKNDPNDRRAILIEPTEKGINLFREIFPDYANNIRMMFADFSPEEVRAMNELFSKILKQ